MPQHKITIIADSHQISSFERCPSQYYWNYVLNRKSKINKKSFAKGTAMHELLFHFYNCKLKQMPYEQCTEFALTTVLALPMWRELTSEEQLLIMSKFSEHCTYWRNEVITPFSVETGFSKTFYEDYQHHFVYEGRIDFIVELSRNRLAWLDHKTQAFKYNVLGLQNQFMGYSWALDYNTGIINYIGLQKSYAPKDAFRRNIVTYTKKQIEEWYKHILKLFFKMAILERTHRDQFEKHRSSCNGKYGVCDYYSLCAETSPNLIRGILSEQYEERPKWIPWEVED